MKQLCLVLFLILVLFVNIACKQKEKSSLSQRLPYYQSTKQDRYLAYQKGNPNLPLEDVVTHVNIGLDGPFYENTTQVVRLEQVDLLVNKYHFLPSNYTPKELEAIAQEYNVSDRQLVHVARIAFEKMAQQAKIEGFYIRAVSAYRSFQYQVELYQRYVTKDGQEKADSYSARPGFSEHQTGLTVDVDNGQTSYTNFESTEEFQWMQQHAHEYGFILRYPKGKEQITGYDYESWHYRYVGEQIAKEIYELDLTFDEYYVRYLDK